MHSLTVRIFLSFWLIIGLLIGLAAIAGYAYSERLREAFENFEIDDTVLTASAILDSDGREGLEAWLRSFPSGSPIEVFVVDGDGRDILERRLPRRVSRLMHRFELRPRSPHDRGRDARNWHRDDSPRIRPARPLTQIVGPDGAVYSLFVSPKRNPYGEWISERAGPAFFLLALLISSAVSYALALAITRPVRKFREATVSIAEGKLDTRVAASMRNRRDEIGMLAHDLDAMADKLQDASDQQTELTRNISHELRSPLARLRVALELARRQTGDLAEFQRIENETERLDGLIGQILSYSRMEARSDEQPQTVDLAELLREAVENANFECRSGGIEDVSVDLACDDAPAVHGYAAALTSAFENVLRNAIRHSPKNGIVSVRVSQDGQTVLVEIEDQGSGVPDESLGKIFEPFYRSVRGHDESTEGTGLGLAIARRAVQKNAGTISAHNAAAGGLCVSIRLPTVTQDD